MARPGRWGGTLLLATAIAHAGPAVAVPDLAGSIEVAARLPGQLAGDIVGGAGLISAATLALAADGLALLDANPVSRPVLRGFFSQVGHRAAMALSWTASGALEGLRGEDIERLPEAPATYLTAAPGVGRVDTALSGVAALGLAVHDAISGPALVLLRAIGSESLAARLATRREDARVAALGPLPLAVPCPQSDPEQGAPGEIGARGC